MQSLKTLAISRARSLLSKHPPDVFHAVEHHQDVCKNILNIVAHEKIDIDTSLLEVAAWWHDVFKGNAQEEKLLFKELTKLTCLKEEIEKIIDIVMHHSFGKKQESIEAKLLYDADKIELVSINRWRTAFRKFDEGQITKKERDKYIPRWNQIVPLIIGNLHFAYSNKLFNQKYQEFIKWIKSIGRYSDGLFV